MLHVVSEWKAQFLRMLWIWLGVSVVVFIFARLVLWRLFGSPLVRYFHVEEYTNDLTALLGGLLLVVQSAAMAWYFHRLFRKHFEFGLQEHVAKVIKARDFYQTLFEGFPALIWRTGVDGKCDYVNDSWLAFTGRTSGQATGSGFADVVHPDDVDRFANEFAAAFKALKPFAMEYRLRRQDGAYRWMQNHAHPFNDINGQFAGYLGTCYDITERREMLEQLKESEARFRSLIDTTPDGIIVHRDGIVAYVNATMCRQLQIADESQAIGKSVFDLVHPDYHEEVRERLRRRKIGEAAFTPMVLGVVRTDGTVQMSEIAATSISLHGAPSILVFVRDISERLKAEKALHENQQRLQLMIQGSTVSVFTLDLDLRYTWLVNPPVPGLAEDILGKTDLESFPPPYGERFTTITRRILNSQKGERHQLEIDMRGELFHYNVCYEPLFDEQHHLVGIGGVATNITDTVLQQQDLLESQERLALAIEANHGGMWDVVVNQDGYLSHAERNYLSPELKAVFGFADDEMDNSPDNILNRVHPDDIQTVHKTLKTTIEGRQDSFSVTFRAFHKDGRIRWFTGSGRLYRDSEGIPRRMIGIDWDITEQMEAVEGTSQNERRYRQLFESVTDGVVLILGDRVVDCNTAVERMSGRTRRELFGKKFFDFTLPVKADGDLSPDELNRPVSVEEASHTISFEWTYRRQDGSELRCEVHLSTIDLDGKRHVLGVIHDITARIEAEHALRESQRTLSTLLNNLPGMAFRLQVRPRHRLEYASNGSIRIFGYAPEGLVARTNSMQEPLTHPDDQSMVQSAIEGAIATGKPLSVEYRIRRHDGSYRWVLEQSSPTTRDDSINVYLEGIVLDIEDRRKLEMQYSLLTAAVEAADEAIVGL